MATLAPHQTVHGPGHPVVAPGDMAAAPEEDASSEDSFKHLRDLDAYNDADAPCGYRFMKGSKFPHLQGHIVPEDMSSGSHSVHKMYFKDGRMVEADDSSSSEEGSDEHQAATGKRKRSDEDSPSQDSPGQHSPGQDSPGQDSPGQGNTEEAPRDEKPEETAEVFPFRTRCGRVRGEDWDGNGQCICAYCLGDLDSQESQGEVAHSQEGAAEEA